MLCTTVWGQRNIDQTPSEEYIQNGISKYAEEDYDGAVKEYGKVQINDTNYAVAQYEMALSYYQLEEYRKSQEILQDLLDFNIRFDFKPRVYLLLGNVLDEQEKSDEALQVYTDALKKYPYQHNLYYNRGVTHEGREDYKSAMADYMQAIQSNIFHANSHFRLGLLMANEKYHAQALMSLMMFVFIDPDDSRVPEVISIIERLSEGTFELDPKNFEVFDGDDPYADCNVLMDNKVALQKKYKAKFTIETSFAKQMHLMLKSTEFEEGNTEFWNAHYMEFYQDIWKNKDLDLLVLTSLANLENEAVKKKVLPKIKKIRAFYGEYQGKLQKIAQDQYVPFEGKEQWVQMNYLKSHLEYIGKTKADKTTPIGNFYYFHSNGTPSMNLSFDNDGKPKGIWEFYNEYDGKLTKKIQFLDKENEKVQMIYYPSGELALKYAMVGENAKDTIHRYYRNGSLKEQYILKDGNYNGFYHVYYPNGQMEKSFNYVDDVLQGDYIIYHPNGKEASVFKVVDGKINGKRVNYYPDGKLQSEFNYLEGDLDGAYTEYFSNGQVSEKGVFKEGKKVGLTESFWSNGQLSYKAELDESGKENGTSTWYDIDGKKYHEFDFTKGELKKIRFYDKQGKEQLVSEKKGKKIKNSVYYPNGIVRREVMIIDGEYDGPYNYYDYYGNLINVELYKEGVLVDSMTRYYSNGQIKTIRHIKEGVEEGLYLEYNIYGDLIEEGLFENDELNKQWIGYRFDGSRNFESYYLDGERHGFQKSFAVDGKLESWTEYDEGIEIFNLNLDTNENIIDRYGQYDGEVKLHAPNNAYVNFVGNYKNGNADGSFTWYGPNKLIETKGVYLNDERTGEWTWYYENGQVSRVINYLDGDRHGVETSYYLSGAKKSEYNYVHGDLEGEGKVWDENGQLIRSGNYLNDERHGKWTYRTPQGDIFMIRIYDQGIFSAYTYIGKDGKEVEPIRLEKNELIVKTYYPNGKVAHEHKRVNGLVEGKYVTYYKNGQVWEDEVYLHGEENGTIMEYSATGKVLMKRETVKGYNHGLAQYYYPNGKLKTETDYLYGEKHGKRLIYDQSGKLQHKLTYYDGDILQHEKL